MLSSGDDTKDHAAKAGQRLSYNRHNSWINGAKTSNYSSKLLYYITPYYVNIARKLRPNPIHKMAA
jgi:hypothetical protein